MAIRRKIFSCEKKVILLLIPLIVYLGSTFLCTLDSAMGWQARSYYRYLSKDEKGSEIDTLRDARYIEGKPIFSMAKIIDIMRADNRDILKGIIGELPGSLEEFKKFVPHGITQFWLICLCLYTLWWFHPSRKFYICICLFLFMGLTLNKWRTYYEVIYDYPFYLEHVPFLYRFWIKYMPF